MNLLEDSIAFVVDHPVEQSGGDLHRQLAKCFPKALEQKAPLARSSLEHIDESCVG